MAERRMFAKTIIDSDAFLDMPLSTQALYFHLSMRADDEGFVNNPKKIARMIGADDDSLKLLIMKNFIIPFESGIVVIKHWRIHNYIRNDRYKQTVYQEERAQLALKDNGAYTMRTGIPNDNQTDTVGIPDGYQMDTQDSIGKDSIGKDREIHTSNAADAATEQIESVFDAFNEICNDLAKIRQKTDARKKTVKARLKEYGYDAIISVFNAVKASDFLSGRSSDWRASFDWIMKPANFVKIREGNYTNRQRAEMTTAEIRKEGLTSGGLGASHRV